MPEAVLTVGQCCLHLQQGGHLGTGQYHLPSVQHPVQAGPPGRGGGGQGAHLDLAVLGLSPAGPWWQPGLGPHSRRLPRDGHRCQSPGLALEQTGYPGLGVPGRGLWGAEVGYSEPAFRGLDPGFGPPQEWGDVQEEGLGIGGPEVVCPRLGGWGHHVHRQTWDRSLGIASLPGRLGPVSYTHLTLPTRYVECRSRWSPYH